MTNYSKISLLTALTLAIMLPAMGSNSPKDLSLVLQASLQESTSLNGDHTGEDDGPRVFIHLVQPGETIASLGRLYRVDLEQLRKANFLRTDDEHLIPGRKLIIP